MNCSTISSEEYFHECTSLKQRYLKSISIICEFIGGAPPPPPPNDQPAAKRLKTDHDPQQTAAGGGAQARGVDGRPPPLPAMSPPGDEANHTQDLAQNDGKCFIQLAWKTNADFEPHRRPTSFTLFNKFRIFVLTF